MEDAVEVTVYFVMGGTAHFDLAWDVKVVGDKLEFEFKSGPTKVKHAVFFTDNIAGWAATR